MALGRTECQRQVASVSETEFAINRAVVVYKDLSRDNFAAFH